MIKNQKQMLVVIGAFVLTLLLGTVTFAFFNYTRTGAANVIRTGRIAFNADQSAQVTLSDLFPITVGENETVTASTSGVGSLSIHVTGDTSYEEGIEYLIKAVNVTGNNGTNLPISIAISYEANTGKSIGTPDDSYFTNRGGNTSVYKVLSNDTIEEGKDLVVGYIAPDNNGTGIDGTLTVMAYLDARNIAITDTNPEGLVRELNPNLSEEEQAACENHIVMSTGFTGTENSTTFCRGTGTRGGKTFQEHLDEGLFTEGQIEDFIEAGIVSEYTDGTSDTWVNNRTVLTTAEWNALQSSGVSFQIKVEANEGTWVTNPVPTIATCPGCVYTYQDNDSLYMNSEFSVLTSADYTNNYEELVASTGRNYFLGLILENGTSGKITRAFACGIKNSVAFCIEHKYEDNEVYTSNNNILQGVNLWNNSCTYLDEYRDPVQTFSDSKVTVCSGVPDAEAGFNGYVNVGDTVGYCFVDYEGEMDCRNY